MFCLAVTILLRRTDNQSALVSLTIVYEGAKAKAAARTYKIQVGWGWGKLEIRIVCISNQIVLGLSCLDTSLFSVLYPKGILTFFLDSIYRFWITHSGKLEFR